MVRQGSFSGEQIWPYEGTIWSPLFYFLKVGAESLAEQLDAKGCTCWKQPSQNSAV